MKIKLTVVGVVLFTIVLLFALKSEEANSEGYIALGKSTFNAHMMIGEIGYRQDGWDLGLQLIGPGETKRGDQAETYIASLSHIVKPGWGDFFIRMGAAYVHDSNLVGDINFKLGVGWDFGPFEVEVGHISSAGIWKTNTGIDGAMLRVKF